MIRVATDEDADEVAAIYIDSRRRYLTFAPLVHSNEEIRTWVREVVIPKSRVLVVVEDSRIAAVMAMSQSDGVSWIDHLYVRPDMTSRGLGARLVEAAKNELPSPIRLFTFQQNDRCRKFYERHGFIAVKFSDGSENEEGCPDVLYRWQQEEPNPSCQPTTLRCGGRTQTSCEEMDADEATTLMQGPLESKDFNRVARWLRGAGCGERITFLKTHFDHPARHRLAISAVNDREEAYEILSFGLDAIATADSQRTKGLAQFGVTKLGAKRTIAELATRTASQPHVVDMALYWLPAMIQQDDPARTALEELQERAGDLGITPSVRRTIHPDGTVAHADRYGA